jgi:hypothetical protein
MLKRTQYTCLKALKVTGLRGPWRGPISINKRLLPRYIDQTILYTLFPSLIDLTTKAIPRIVTKLVDILTRGITKLV